jgi:hypothetical protein
MKPVSHGAAADMVRTSSHPSRNTRDAVGALLALAGESVVLLLGFSSDVAITVTLALHAAIVAALAIFLFAGRDRGSDVSMAATVLLVVMVAGPAGAAVALAALALYEGVDTTAGEPGAILEEWYERLAAAGQPPPATQFHDRIMSGRVPRLDAPGPQNFMHVIDRGTLDERQKALGLIARHFHPDYTPVLEAALKSPEPVVRVQAAAVVAHVKANLKTRIRTLTSDGKNAAGAEALLRINELQALQECALVEKSERALCRDTVQSILERTLAMNSDLVAVSSQAGEGAVAGIEHYFLSAGRYKELRVLRRLRGIMKRPASRLRRFNARKAA